MSVSLRWLGTAGIKLTCGDAALLIDPYLTRNPQAVPAVVAREEELFPAQAIFVSHGHFDHAADVPDLAKAHQVPVFTDRKLGRNLARHGVPEGLLRAIEPGRAIGIGPFTVTAQPVRHVHFGASLIARTLWRMGIKAPSYLPLLTEWPCGQPYALRIEVEGFTVLHMGTAGATERELDRLRESGPADLLLVALQGNDRIHEIAGHIVEKLAPRMVIPIHQDDFYPPVSSCIAERPFLDEVARRSPDTRTAVLPPGESLVLPVSRRATA